MGGALVRTIGLSKTYGSGALAVHALREASLEVDPGELLAVMGASGSGKTTLMNLLGLLDRPTSGSYLLAGLEVSGLGRNRCAELRNRTLGFVFQSFNLLPGTSALDNVKLPLVYAGMGRRERTARSRETLERVGLGDRLAHRPGELSGGEQQRVAIARALVNRPRLILADEPTGNLDSRTSVEVMALFQSLVAQGIAVVCVTHEPDIARYASRLVLMRDGRIVRDEPQLPVRASPARAPGPSLQPEEAAP